MGHLHVALVENDMNVSVPYDELTLKIALMGASKKLEVDGLQERILEKISSISSKTMSEFNQAVAEYHGISVLDLINSPNYESLKGEFGNHNISRLVSIYKEEGFDDKESWALVCVSMGNILD